MNGVSFSGGATRERAPLGLPAHFEVKLGILLRSQLVLYLVRGSCHGYFHGGGAVVGGATYGNTKKFSNAGRGQDYRGAGVVAGESTCIVRVATRGRSWQLCN